MLPWIDIFKRNRMRCIHAPNVALGIHFQRIEKSCLSFKQDSNRCDLPTLTSRLHTSET